MGRLLVAAGLGLALVGLLVMAGVPIGRLPGDIVIRRGQTTIYLPIVTCAIASLVLTAVLMLLRR